MRAGRFPRPADGLDRAEQARVDRFRPSVAGRVALVSPARAAGETATLLGLEARVEDALRDIDAGDWAGRALDALDPAGVARWLGAPERGTPNGETMAEVTARVSDWLEAGADRERLAVTHPPVIRAALVHALGLPIAAAFAIDIAPLSTTVLSHTGRWRLQEIRRA